MIIENNNLNIEQIADSGQCFRMNQIGDQAYSVIAYNRYIELKQIEKNQVEISCSEQEWKEVWEEYFDMNYDYKSLIDKILAGDDVFLKEAVTYGEGIRILQQEPFEMLISFIISQNKNIPAIKKCVELICEKYGERRISEGGNAYFTFPDPHVLATATKEELRESKAGYRDQYIIAAAKAVADGTLDLHSLKKCSYHEAIEELKRIPGVGDKVASCVALFGLHHIEAFPIDVWIKRVLKEVYGDCFDVYQFPGCAGIVQQYMFYYRRSFQEQ